MTGLCGWFGPDCAHPAQLIAAMGTALPPFPGEESHSKAEPAAGLLASRGHARGDARFEEDVWAAIVGYPRWLNTELRGLAVDRGAAAALAEAWRRKGPGLLACVDGSFALAVFDRANNTALLAIDRMGVEPLTFGRTENGVVFGSATGAVRTHPDVGATIPAQAIYNYLYYYFMPSPRSIYAEQEKLLPGHYALVKNGRVETHSYWSMPYRQEGGNRAALGQQMVELLRHGVQRSLDGEDRHKTGSFLSGGLDSSSVTGMLAGEVGEPPAFTIGFGLASHDETDYARIAARHFGVKHTIYEVTPADILAAVPAIARFYDEPFGNSSALPSYICAKLAREAGMELLLAGDGGDEIFAGNERYVSMSRIEKYGRIPALLRRGLIEPVSQLPGIARSRLGRKAQALAGRYYTPMPDRLHSYSLWGELMVEDILSPALLAEIDPREPAELARLYYNQPKQASMVQRMMHLDLVMTLADNDLRKVNRTAQLAGLRVRYPMLDTDLVEFAANLSDAVLLDGLKLRDFYKYAMRDFLPREIITKSKHGFGLPFISWMKVNRDLQDMAGSAVDAFARRGYLHPAFVRKLRAACSPGEVTGLEGMAWDVMMLEYWLESRSN